MLPFSPRTFIKVGVALPDVEVLSPLTRAFEVDPLVDAGATAFYAGVLTADWRKAFSTLVAGNQEPAVGANFPSLEELKDAVDRAHERKAPVTLTLNLDYYTHRQREHLGRLMDAAADAGVDGFLIADVPTMVRARTEHPDVRLHVSTIAPAFNSAALEFYEGLGASRVVLPQQLTPEEIVALARDSPVELEVFVLNNRCVNVDGFCTFVDGMDEAVRPLTGRIGFGLLNSRWALQAAKFVPKRALRHVRRLPGLRPAPCLLDYNVSPVTIGSVPLEGMAAARQRMGGHFGGKTGVDCGACVLRTLLRAGITAVKIDGRPNDMARKLQDVRFITDILKAAKDDTIPDSALYTRTRRTFRQGYSGECTDLTCYYRDFLPGH